MRCVNAGLGCPGCNGFAPGACIHKGAGNTNPGIIAWATDMQAQLQIPPWQQSGTGSVGCPGVVWSA